MASEPVQTPTTRDMHKTNDNFPDILRKLINICGCFKRKCSKGQLNEAIQCHLCALWVHVCESVNSETVL